MASHEEFVLEWTMLSEDHNNWTLNDLQLAAELGRNLLERNEELENELKSQQVIIDDQAQEIEFLAKQVSSLKEESSTQRNFYEQLETSIYELERLNTQLTQEREIDKKRIKSMSESIDYLEHKCEELGGTIESIRESTKKQMIGNHTSANNNNNKGVVDQFLSFMSGSDSSSSEDDGNFSFGSRRKFYSLQDIRDFTPSPYDEFESHSSNSPDLKISESEFIQTLETRLEELLKLKKNESERVLKLETHLQDVIQENMHLKEQILKTNRGKESESGSFFRKFIPQSPTIEEINRFSILPNKLINSEHSSDHSSLCRRCSMELHVLNLVGSIEHESDEFSSLEFELATANSLSKNSNFNQISSPIRKKEESSKGFFNFFNKFSIGKSSDSLKEDNYTGNMPMSENSDFHNKLDKHGKEMPIYGYYDNSKQGHENNQIFQNQGMNEKSGSFYPLSKQSYIENLELLSKKPMHERAFGDKRPELLHESGKKSENFLKKRKMKLPVMIPDEFETSNKKIEKNTSEVGFDEEAMREASEVTVGVNSRSKEEEEERRLKIIYQNLSPMPIPEYKRILSTVFDLLDETKQLFPIYHLN